MSKKIIETLKKGLSNKHLSDAQRKSVQDKIEALEKAESKSEEKKEVEQPKAKKQVVAEPKPKYKVGDVLIHNDGFKDHKIKIDAVTGWTGDGHRYDIEFLDENLKPMNKFAKSYDNQLSKSKTPKKEKVVKQPKAEKDVEDEKPFDNDEYCREIIAQETEKKAKRKEAAEKRKDAPKKKEATKIKEGIERLEDKVEEKVSKGKITKAEIIKLIDNTKALLKSLEKQLKEFGTKKMAEGGNVEESYNYFYYKQPISKSQFLANVPKNWRKEIDEYYEYSYGGYRASLRDDSDIDAFAKGGNVGDLKVGDIFEGTPNATYEENWQLHKPSISYIIDNKTNRIVSIHNSPHEAIKERNKLNPHFKLHFKVYPKEHYQTKMAEGGNVEESEFKNMSAKDFVKEYYGINVFKSNPSEYFDIQKLSSSNDDKVEQFINKYKNEGYSIKKKSYSDFTGLLAAKRKNDINKLAKGGNVEGGYKIFVGHDHRKNHELYQVVGIDNDYVGEWHKDKKDAEDELKDLDGISDSVSKFAEGGNVGNGDKFTYMMLSRLQMDNDYYLGMGNRSARNLWAGSVDEQIKEMKRLWNSLPEDRKPEWLSMEDIKEYEKEMTSDKYAKGGSIKRTKNAIDADKNLRAMPKGERVSHPFAIIRKANGETFKRRNANQFGEVEGDGVYTENRANRTDKDQKKRF